MAIPYATNPYPHSLKVPPGVGVDGVGGICPLMFIYVLSFLRIFFLRFSLFLLGHGANNCNLLQKWGILLRPRLYRPRGWGGIKNLPFQPVPKKAYNKSAVPASVQAQPLGEGKWGCTKHRRIPKCEGDYQGRVPKRFLPRETLENKRFGAPIFWGISPKLLAALRGIHPFLSTPVLPRGQNYAKTTLPRCTVEKMDYTLNYYQEYFYVTYVMYYMIITYFYSLKTFLCKGGLC